MDPYMFIALSQRPPYAPVLPGMWALVVKNERNGVTSILSVDETGPLQWPKGMSDEDALVLHERFVKGEI